MPDTLRSERKGRRASAAAVAAIAAIAALAGPAAAQDLLVSNLSTSASGREGLADSEYIQSFTTGPNVSGYLLESISIDFVKGSVGARDPVYVYLYEDNGSGRPRSRAIATLTKNGINFAPPVTGVNKYKIWKARCYPVGSAGGCLQDPSSVHLAPNTTYWVYVWAGRSTTGAELQSDTATAETGAAGWTLGNSAFSKPSWGSSDGVYTYTSISAPLLIKVEGKTNPEVLVSITDVTVTEGVERMADFVVSLSRKASGPVQVSYGTFDLFGSSPADEGSDYEATSGTLTFRPGQTRKTVSVPILDDARNEGDETFGLALTNLQGATFAANSGTGTIVNADPLTVSVGDATATEGVDATIDFTVSLNRATNRRLTVNVLFSSGTADFSDITEPDQTSVTFEPGQTQKTYSIGIVDDTENEPSETFSVILQSPLPTGRLIVGAPGSGTINNTETLEASFENIPQDHDGTNTFTFQVHFTNDVSITPAAMRDHAFTVTNGDVTGASRVDGRDDRWLITVDPDGDDAVTITLPGNRTCGTQGAICSKEDNPVQLTNSPSVTVAAPPEGDPLTASFSNVPDSHDGGDFHVDLTFSEGPDIGYSDVQKAVKVSGGSINRANRKTRGSSVGWKLKVRPAGTGALTITLPATLNCSSSGAICTEDGRRLSHSLSTVVAGPVITPAVSVADASAAEGDAVAFTVSLSEASSRQVTVEYATSDATATAGSDYTATSGTLTFAAGETTKTVSVATTDDSVDEEDETFTLTLSSPANATLGDATAAGTINDDDESLPAVSVFDASAAEGDAVAFTVSLSEASSQQVTVEYATSDGTATGGTDFTAQSGTLTFTAGETTKTVSVATTDDSADEDDETLTLTLSSPANATLGDATATGTINDDDSLPAVSVADASAAEGDAVAFTVSLSEASSQQVTVEYATSDGTAAAGEDYTATSGTLAFQAGEVTKTISVPTTEDTVDDGGETFTLALSNPSSGVQLGDAEATGTIRNTEAAAELSASFPESAYTSKRHAGSDDRPQVVVAFSEPVADFDKNTPSVTVTGASGLSVQTHTEDGLENAYVFFMTPDGDGDVTFALTTNAACASGGICTAGGTVLTQVPGPRTIPGPDDESLPAVSVADGSAAEGDAVAFTVSLSAASSRQVTVQYATSGGTATSGTDFTAQSGTLTFAANETSKTVSVATTDDSVDEEDETFTLTLSSPANATLGDATATGTIDDNDNAAPLTASFSNMPPSHTGDEFTFGLAFSENVELGYVTLRDTAFVVTGGEVKTAQRQQQGSNQEWTITVEPSGQGAVTITLPETTDCRAADAICTGDGRPLSHSLSSVVAGPVIIPAVSVSDASAAEGDAVAFTVSLSSASSQQVTVEYATSGGTATSGTDFTAESGTLTFAANETSKTVSVATTDDSVDEDDETFTLTLSSPANATLGDATATGTINDDDDAAPLTASFTNMPASHTGGEFTFGLGFSENVELSYVTLRDTAFVVTGGEVKTAQRQQQGSNQAWNITVEPASANDTVTITLPETTDCNAVDAICTDDGRPLSHSLSATVVDAASSSAGDAVGGDAADDALDVLDGVTPDHAAAALVGEATLSEAQLKALDRLGNRNGRFDLGDMLSWRDRCGRGEARCGRVPADPGPASAAVLLAAAAAGRRRTSRRPKRRTSGWRPARRPTCALALLLAATTAWSCTGDLVGPPAAERPGPATAEAGPGFLTVEWTAPAAGRAIGVLLELEGPGIDAVVGAPGLELYHSAQPGRHRIVVAGGLEDGPLLRFRVPDRGRLALYRVRVTEVTGEDYGLRDTGEYRAVIALAAQHRQRIGRESPDPRSSVTPPMGPQEGG